MVEIKKFRVPDMETWESVPDLCENAGNQAAITTVLVCSQIWHSFPIVWIEESRGTRYSGHVSSITWSAEFKQILVRTFLLSPILLNWLS